VNKPLKNFKKLSEIIKSIKETENNHKNSFFNLGRNSMEIVHRPFDPYLSLNHTLKKRMIHSFLV
jgi:hypothetical protein